MAIKFFCDRCGKEIWQGLTTERRIAALSERECVCSDCTLAERWMRRGEDSESPCTHEWGFEADPVKGEIRCVKCQMVYSESPDPDPEMVTVCDKCLCASCWQGIFYCDDYRDAGIVQKTVAELQSLNLENPDYWKRSDSESPCVPCKDYQGWQDLPDPGNPSACPTHQKKE